MLLRDRQRNISREYIRQKINRKPTSTHITAFDKRPSKKQKCLFGNHSIIKSSLSAVWVPLLSKLYYFGDTVSDMAVFHEVPVFFFITLAQGVYKMFHPTVPTENCTFQQSAPSHPLWKFCVCPWECQVSPPKLTDYADNAIIPNSGFN